MSREMGFEPSDRETNKTIENLPAAERGTFGKVEKIAGDANIRERPEGFVQKEALKELEDAQAIAEIAQILESRAGFTNPPKGRYEKTAKNLLSREAVDINSNREQVLFKIGQYLEARRSFVTMARDGRATDDTQTSSIELKRDNLYRTNWVDFQNDAEVMGRLLEKGLESRSQTLLEIPLLTIGSELLKDKNIRQQVVEALGLFKDREDFRPGFEVLHNAEIKLAAKDQPIEKFFQPNETEATTSPEPEQDPEYKNVKRLIIQKALDYKKYWETVSSQPLQGQDRENAVAEINRQIQEIQATPNLNRYGNDPEVMNALLTAPSRRLRLLALESIGPAAVEDPDNRSRIIKLLNNPRPGANLDYSGLSAAIFQNEAVMLAAERQEILPHVDWRLYDDPKFVLAIMKKIPDAVKYAGDRVKQRVEKMFEGEPTMAGVEVRQIMKKPESVKQAVSASEIRPAELKVADEPIENPSVGQMVDYVDKNGARHSNLEIGTLGPKIIMRNDGKEITVGAEGMAILKDPITRTEHIVDIASLRKPKTSKI